MEVRNCRHIILLYGMRQAYISHARICAIILKKIPDYGEEIAETSCHWGGAAASRPFADGGAAASPMAELMSPAKLKIEN